MSKYTRGIYFEFNFEDSLQYILFRQTKPGKKENVFSSEAIEKIYEHAGIKTIVAFKCSKISV